MVATSKATSSKRRIGKSLRGSGEASREESMDLDEFVGKQINFW